MQAVVEHRHGHGWIPGNRFHHHVIDVGLRRACTAGSVADELEAEFQVARQLGADEVIVIEHKR